MAFSNTKQHIHQLGYVVIVFCISHAVCHFTGHEPKISPAFYPKPVLHNDNNFDKEEIHSKLDLPVPEMSHVTSLVPVELLKLRHRRNSPKRCRKPRLKNGKVRPKRPKNEVYFKCKGKYMLVGSKYATCKRGQWSPPPPVCVKTGCRPPDVDHTPLSARFFYDGAIMSFACPSGYELRGPRSIFCDGSTWNTGPPVCRVSSTIRTATVSSTMRTTTVTTKPSVATVTTKPSVATVTSTPKITTISSTPSTITLASTPNTTIVSSTLCTTTISSTTTTTTISSTTTTTTVSSTPTTTAVSSTPTTTTISGTPTTTTVSSTPTTTTVSSTPSATIATTRSTSLRNTTAAIKLSSTLWTRTVTDVPSETPYKEITTKSNRTTLMIGPSYEGSKSTGSDVITPDSTGVVPDTGYDVTDTGTVPTSKTEIDDRFQEASSLVLGVSQTSVLGERTTSPSREHPDQESPSSYQKYPDKVSITPSDSNFLDPEITDNIYNPDSYDRTRVYEVSSDLDSEYTQKSRQNKHATSTGSLLRNNDITPHVISSIVSRDDVDFQDTTIRSSLSKSYERAKNRQRATLAGLISGVIIVALVIGIVVIVVARWLHQQNVLDLAEVEEFGSVPYQTEEEVRNDDLVGTKV